MYEFYWEEEGERVKRLTDPYTMNCHNSICRDYREGNDWVGVGGGLSSSQGGPHGDREQSRLVGATCRQRGCAYKKHTKVLRVLLGEKNPTVVREEGVWGEQWRKLEKTSWGHIYKAL